jgi:hypothetical protein
MKNNIFYIIAFLFTGALYGQDSSARNAVGKQSDVIANNTNANSSVKSNPDQSKKSIQSVNATDTLSHQIIGDYNDKRRTSINEKKVKEEPK